MLKRILHITLWILAFAGLAFLLAFTTIQNNATVCKGINYTFVRSQNNRFVDSAYVNNLFANRGYTVVGNKLANLNLASLEDALRSCPEVANAQVSTTLNGNVNITVTERKPLVRILNSDGNGYYIDELGKLMPLSDKFTAHVPIATGSITEAYGSYNGYTIADIEKNTNLAEALVIDDVYNVAQFIAKDTLWAAQIAGIDVLGRNNFALTPLLGNHTIILGNSQNLTQKFDNLKAFYRDATAKGLLAAVNTINVMYKNQVVVTYKNTSNGE